MSTAAKLQRLLYPWAFLLAFTAGVMELANAPRREHFSWQNYLTVLSLTAFAFGSLPIPERRAEE